MLEMNRNELITNERIFIQFKFFIQYQIIYRMERRM
jgi:hypothetical protein